MNIKAYIQTILAGALLTACTNDFVPELPKGTESEDMGMILFGRPRPSAGLSWHDGRVGSRDASTDIESMTPDDIGVFAFGNGPNTTYIFRNQRVYFYDTYNDLFEWKYWDTANNKEISAWPYTTEPGGSVQRPWEKMKYRFFAYSPWYETKDVTVSAENYDGFNAFTWDNIPGFTDYDYVLTNKIQDLDNSDGDFVTDNPIVLFEMRHILSRIRFFFRMSEEYRRLRRFELNSITILTAGSYKSATFNFKDDAWDETVHWTNETMGNADPVTLTSITGDAYTIPTEYPEEPYTNVYVYPQAGFNEITMQIDYTVYDSQGVATRNANLTNIIKLPNWTLESGYYYDVRIYIVPDYMYVLSDNDKDFDGYVIIKETPTP